MSYEGAKYEYKFLVFSILNGPKNMIDNLNAEGKDGWEAYDNQEEHGEELWKRIAETEMDKFVRLLGGEFY